MMNIIRADLYRIFRGKGIYITVAVLLLLIVLRVFTDGTVGIGTGVLEEMAEQLANTGANAPFMAMADAGTFLYFLLPLVIIVASSDFSSGGVKNILASGTSRTKYYISKLILACFFCAVLLLLNIIISTVIASIANGFGGTLNADYIISVIKPFGLQLLLSIAATCVGIFLTFTTKSTGAVTGIYIAWLFVPIMVVFMLMDISDSFAKLANYDLTINIQALANFNMMAAEDIVRVFAIGIFYMLAGTICGLALFKRSEIK